MFTHTTVTYVQNETSRANVYPEPSNDEATTSSAEYTQVGGKRRT